MRVVFALAALTVVIFVSGCASEDTTASPGFPSRDYWWR